MRQVDAATHAVPPQAGERGALPRRDDPIVLVVDDDERTHDVIDLLRDVAPYSIDVMPVERDVLDDTIAARHPDALRAQQLDTLSKREREVIQELVDGYSFTEAAGRLFVSRHTFRTHMKNILAKFDVHSSLEAVSIAVRAGMRPRTETPEAG